MAYASSFFLDTYAQSFDSVSNNVLITGSFSLKTVEKETTEDISGTIKYFNNSIYLEIKSPLEQNVLVSGSELTMYYPESNQAIEFIGKTPFDLPIISSIIPLFKEDYGLSDIGYILDDFTVQGDTSLSTWIPHATTEQNSDAVFKLLYVNDVLHWVQHESSTNALSITTQLVDYKKFKDFSIPTRIITTKVIEKKEVIEYLTLSNISTEKTTNAQIRIIVPENADRKVYQF